MKILHLSIISVVSVFILFITLTSQANGDISGPLPTSYPENKTMQLSLSYNPAGSTMNNTVGTIHLRFFDARTNTPIKNVSFFLNVTKGDQQLLYNLFYSHSGNFTLKLQLGGSGQQWRALPQGDLVFIGGLEESIYPISVLVSAPLKEGNYHIEIQPVVYDMTKHSIPQYSGIDFDAYLNLKEGSNQIMEKIPEFSTGIIVLLISISFIILISSRSRLKF